MFLYSKRRLRTNSLRVSDNLNLMLYVKMSNNLLCIPEDFLFQILTKEKQQFPLLLCGQLPWCFQHSAHEGAASQEFHSVSLSLVFPDSARLPAQVAGQWGMCAVLCGERKIIFWTALTIEQPRQDKNLLYWNEEPNEPNKEEPLSYVLKEPICRSFNCQQGSPFSVSLSLSLNYSVFKSAND